MRTRGWKAVVKAAIPARVLLCRGKTQKGAIALTFDDGPVPGITDRVLDMLSTRGHRATFFVIGNRAEANLDLIGRIRAAGCEVGNHTYSHANISTLTYDGIRKEIESTDTILAASASKAPPFRPPEGRISLPLLAYLRRRKGSLAAPVLWSVCVAREHRRTPQDIADTLCTGELAAGDIVLLHDDHPGIVQALPRILDHLEQRGMRSVPVSEIC